MRQALILAAGKGERMRPLTDTCPKPLLSIAGKPLIVWHLEKLVSAGITHVVINVSYLGEQIVNTLGSGQDYGVQIHYSKEVTPLESGGGIAQALPLLHDEPFLLISADVFSNIDYATLQHDSLKSPAHFVLVPQEPGLVGEFGIDAHKLIIDSKSPVRYNWASIAVLHPRLCEGMPRGEKFKLMPYLIEWIAHEQVSAEVFNGAWENLTTTSQYFEVKQRYEQSPIAI